jgi:hypothetical protein
MLPALCLVIIRYSKWRHIYLFCDRFHLSWGLRCGVTVARLLDLCGFESRGKHERRYLVIVVCAPGGGGNIYIYMFCLV